ncbi:MAG: acyl-CoA dehydrogenase [Armatimonadota bacterium]|nr:acyl-CoA dehydrogenase [Armatimonadota bacterium]MDR7439213.1 acyl-CoA dehydrogenase [Armatimonadota bacterium]MDR7563681.1 acyl-CoA dehydrogenase [Armatimonadota bacterium]MDR7567603.1 acyl-CoA dehydrogenase [Armatimonadota bacterium]MDR7602002.1 acyl-CoA dehydrogenase [Armatimonadota bacterium]
MDFALREEYRLVQQTARAFAIAEILPQAARLDEEHRFPAEIVRRLGELGMMGILVPEAYGGAGMDTLAFVIALEEISRACAGTGAILAVNNSLVCDPILRFGTEEQKRRYLPILASGREIGCYCLTEPAAGSDAASLRTTAREDGPYWVLNGTKSFVTNGAEAWLAIVFARSEPTEGSRGISAFLVEKDRPGMVVARVERKLGINASSTCEVRLEDCRIPRENLLGSRGQGFRIAMHTLDGGRIGIAAQAVGIARAALEDALAYAQKRVQFGRRLVDFQAIQWKFADMSTRIEAARLLTYRAAWLRDRGSPHTLEASVAKLFASETAMWAAHQGMQVFGGYGYLRDYPAERHFRDARVTEIYEGTSEIQRFIIARRLLEGGNP